MQSRSWLPNRSRNIFEFDVNDVTSQGGSKLGYDTPFVSMVIHGLLSLLSSLVFRSLFNCFRMLICGFKYFCKLNFVMIRVWMYTKCLFIFRKMFLKKTLTL